MKRAQTNKIMAEADEMMRVGLCLAFWRFDEFRA
jgi:hypothetical protein